MSGRRFGSLSRRGFLAAAGAVGGAAVAGCSQRTSGPNEVRMWGVGGDSRDAEQKVIDTFQQKNPTIKVTSQNVPSSGNSGDATSVITAVRGKTAPDLWWMDRFAGAQYAALGLLEPIDDLIEKYEEPGFLDAWLPFTVNELSYQGKMYGLPTVTDTRGLYYNKTLLRQAGVDPDELDMSNGPITVERLFEIGDKITKTDKIGNFTRMGFVPWQGQGSGYTWSMGLHAQYFDPKTCELTMTSDPIIDAYQLSYDFARKNDYSRIDAFIKSYEPDNAPPGQTAFNGGKLGMVIETSGTAHTISKYAPKLDWGYTHLPVFKAGDDPYTWSGGFSLVMPKGSSRSEAAWEFMKHYAGVPGQTIYCPPTSSLPTQEAVFDIPALKSVRTQLSQLSYSTSRPPIPVGALWWDAVSQVMSTVKIGSATPRAALERAQDRVDGQMQTYCPFTLPKGYSET
ncbi:ABC transporter substrate-binding protein [Microlunatus soli]|uniref:Tat (Twin-arginine translocation) pathway signal sequence n=1 Tax=Microlunatus soli TaxID=630515 RepID=A0A1H1W3Z1_9ACTN|nr:ABC transporter substrate-binding protein [Microlunatus soli]SDS91401.1 Tat (twin-arginine translocation) pathway signal sequence [Microlunatus soli]